MFSRTVSSSRSPGTWGTVDTWSQRSSLASYVRPRPDAATTPMTKATPMMTSATAGSRRANLGARVQGAVRSSVRGPECVGGSRRL